MNESRQEFVSRFAHYSQYGGQFKRAVDAVLDSCVKKHVFRPSGRVIYTVVGRSGDEFIDPERPFCSCQHFFYRVLGGRDRMCYHLLSYKIACESENLEEVVFHDEEYATFLELLGGDLISPLRDKEDKES
jgi:predicted nucleic acid-binding Zn finger protein